MKVATAALVVLALVLVPALAAGSSTSPVAPPSGSGSCPPSPIVPGRAADDGALVVLLQPGPSSGSTCGLSGGGTLVGDQVIVGLYTPNPVPGDAVQISVEEWVPATETVYEPGPNGTNFSRQIPIENDVDWSNATVPAGPGQVQEFYLNVPSVVSREELTIGILGANLTVWIQVPGAGIAIPVDYPQLLVHDFEFQVWVVIFFVVGVGIATGIRLRARHVERIWPIGAFGIVASVGFGLWALSDYPSSLLVLGSFPEAVVATPVVLAGMYLWLALFPSEARLHKIEYPVADVRDGERLYNEKRFRLYNGPDGPEYIGKGGAGALLRILGIRTLFDDRALNLAPYRLRFEGFRRIRSDVYAKYYAWAEFDATAPVLTVVPPRIFWLPWRKRTREAISEYHRKALRGRVPEPAKVGALLYVTPSRAFAAVVGRQGAILVQGWIAGTLQASRTGYALEKVLVAYTHLKVSLRAEAVDLGHKIALTLRMAEEYPGSPIALKALEDLATRHEAALMDEREWFRLLEQKVQEDRTPTDPPGSVGAGEDALNDVRKPAPRDLRRDRGGRQDDD